MRRCSRPCRRLSSAARGASVGALLGLALSMILVGCVSSGTHQEVVTERDGLRTDKARLTERVRLLEASTKSLDAERVQLIDRIPVADNTDVRIKDVQIEPYVVPNENGIINHSVRLAPGEIQVLRLSYTVDYPTALLEALKSQPPSPAMEESLYDQLNTLEQYLE